MIDIEDLLNNLSDKSESDKPLKKVKEDLEKPPLPDSNDIFTKYPASYFIQRFEDELKNYPD